MDELKVNEPPMEIWKLRDKPSGLEVDLRESTPLGKLYLEKIRVLYERTIMEGLAPRRLVIATRVMEAIMAYQWSLNRQYRVVSMLPEVEVMLASLYGLTVEVNPLVADNAISVFPSNYDCFMYGDAVRNVHL